MSGPHDPVQTLLEALRAHNYKAVKSGAGFRAQCPAHAGNDLNLKIDRGDDGRALLNCKVHGCEAAAMVEAIGLTLSDLFPDGPDRSQPRVPIIGKGPAPQSQAASAPAPQAIERAYDYVSEHGEIVYQAVRNNPSGDPPQKTFKQRRPDGKGGWIWNMNGVQPIPYRLPQLIASDGLIIIAEGEKDVHALESLGFTATTNHGGAGKWKPELSRWLAGRDVAVIPDNDEPGTKHAYAVAASLHGTARSVRVLDPMPGVGDKGDPFDWISAGGTAEQLRALIDGTAEWEPGEAKATGPRLELVSLANVQPRAVDWYWTNWLARGKLHILAGHPGDGKSTLTAWLAATLSNGAILPDGSIAPNLGTLFLLGEDALDDTLRPRLDLHGADCTKITAIKAAVSDAGKRSVLNLGKHIDLIRDELQTGKYGLLVVDPLTAFMPKTDRNAEGDVRDVLTPLADVADETGTAVLAVMHIGKGPKDTGRRVLQMILGATAFGAAARLVWINAEIPESGDPVKRILQVIKSNIGPKPAPFEWARAIDGPVIWHGESERDIEDVLSGAKVSKLETACDFLRRELANGGRTQAGLEQAAKGEGILPGTLKRAKTHLGVVSKKPEGTQYGPWLWELPTAQGEHNANDAPLDAMQGETTQGAQGEQNSLYTKNAPLEHVDPSGAQGEQNLTLEHLDVVRVNGGPNQAHGSRNRNPASASPAITCKACGSPRTHALACPSCGKYDHEAIALAADEVAF